MRRLSFTAVLAALAAVAAALAAGGATASRKDVTINLVAYSTPAAAYAKLIPAFQATPAGKGVSINASYGASTDQTRAVANGLPADLVALSLEPDITDLVAKNLIKPNWQSNKWHGMITDSVATFVVRNGNPKHIAGWSDLVRPGIGIVTPDPISSGAARWNIMAAYGAQLKLGKTPAQARAYLRQLLANVVSFDKSGRQALQTFSAGKGDVLLTYENEARYARTQNQPLYFVIPRATLLIENPIAVTTTARGDNLRAANDFLRFLHTRQAQDIFAQNGYRPLYPELVKKYKFPAPPSLFTIEDLGGWAKVTRNFFDPGSGIVTRILSQRSRG